MPNKDKIVLDKVIEYLKADKENGNLDAQAYAEHLHFWIDNWIEGANINE
jgi:hypothetical protein